MKGFSQESWYHNHMPIWTKEYHTGTDVALLSRYIQEKGYEEKNIAYVIQNALECGVTRSKFLRAKGTYTLWEAKTLAHKLGMDFWTFYNIFLRDLYEVEEEDVNFLKPNKEFTLDYELPGTLILW